MPELTKNSLEKRFTCHYCGKSIRTRQGLSGHIQFKHGTKQKHQKPDLTLTVPKAVDLKLWREGLNLSKSTFDAAVDTVIWWDIVRLFCEVFDIELNQQDLKNYLITSLVQIHQNEQLKQDIIEKLGRLTEG